MQRGGYGVSRLLAAVLVGLDGRSLLNFTDQERDRFDALIRESRFYRNEAAARFSELSKELAAKEGDRREG